MDQLAIVTISYTHSCTITAKLTDSETVAISLSLLAVVCLIMGLIVGSLATYCIMKKKRKLVSREIGISHGPLYEEVTRQSKEKCQMDENVAYGLVGH